MVTLTLVRHGQAQAGARDEAGYDRLSPLGHQQAEWLGGHFRALDQRFDRLIAGRLLRHQETAARIAGVLGLPVETDPDLDEMDYFGLARSMEETHALPFPSSRDSFIAHLPQVLTAWEQGLIAAPAEGFHDFAARVGRALERAGAVGGRVLLVTSGGVIGMAMRQVLGLAVPATAGMMLQIHNTSLHRYVAHGNRLVLDLFNAVPHLETPERLFARTWL